VVYIFFNGIQHYKYKSNTFASMAAYM